ncbi:MAG: winged helix-turn-helix domain-containing protein [Sulfolobales archaeon]
MKKRSRARIVYDILNHLAFRGSTTITGVSYIARMPYDRAEELVMDLEKRGLVRITKTESGRIVSITDKGLKALEDLEKAIKILEKLGLDTT